MVATSSDTHSLIDDLLPNHDFSAAYEIGIHAPASTVYERLLVSDFHASWIVRLLLWLRTGRRVRRHRVPGDLHERLKGTGFVILAEAPSEEIVIGVAGKFWRPDGGRCLNLRAGDFVEFSRAGEAKAAWNFKLTPKRSHGTLLSTETRIECFGWPAWWKFRLYWSLIAPFSGVMRKAMLRQVKAEAESAT